MGAIDSDSGVKTGLLATFFNVINSFFGSAVLGLPYGFRMSGHVAGVITLILVGLVARYCMQLLIMSREHILSQGKRKDCSYGDIGEFAYGATGKKIVDGSLAFTQFGFCCVYMIFLGTNMHDLFPSVSSNTYVFWCMVALVLISWFRSLKFLSPFSLLAECCTVGGLLVVNWYALGLIMDPEVPPTHTKALQPATFPVFFGIATAAFEGIGLVIPIQQSMKDPKKYTTLLNVSFVFVTLFFVATGVTSYKGFGHETKSIITLNLPYTQLSTLVKTMMCIAIFFTYPVQMFVLLELAEEYLLSNVTQQMVLSKCLRSSLVLATAIVAVLVPNFGEAIGLLGSVGCPLLAYILPAVFYGKIFRKKITQRHQLLLSGIVAVGILGGMTAFLDVLVSVDE